MQLPHVISAKDFTRAQLDALFRRTTEIKERRSSSLYCWHMDGTRTLNTTLRALTMALLFDQPSLRTASSFETAMYALGGNCITFRNASRETSIAKDESLEDTIEMLSGNPTVSVLVLRHPQAGAAQIATRASSVPVINAGDGTEHPTQALVDLFTIQEALGSVDGKRIFFIGDMHARTAKSLLYALTLYRDVEIWFCYQLPHPEEDAWNYVRNCGLPMVGVHLTAGLEHSDVIYVIRPQQENWHKDMRDPKLRQKTLQEDLSRYYKFCTVNNQVLAHMPQNSIVLHPRPRGPELPTEVDSDPRVRHVQQGRNGGPVRIALLEMMHSGEWQKLAKQ